MRATFQRVQSLAGLDFHEFLDDLEALGPGDPPSPPRAGLPARGRNGLLLGRDAIVSDEGLHLRERPDHRPLAVPEAWTPDDSHDNSK